MRVKINCNRIMKNNKKAKMDNKYIAFVLRNKFNTFTALKAKKFNNVNDSCLYELDNDCPWIFHISDLIVIKDNKVN